MVPVGKNARRGRSGEVGAQPLLLWGADPTATHLRAVRVQRDEVPRADVVAVVTLRGIARNGSKVLVVARGARGAVVVVPRHRPGQGFDPTPRGVVGADELRECPVLVLIVAESQDGCKVREEAAVEK